MQTWLALLSLVVIPHATLTTALRLRDQHGQRDPQDVINLHVVFANLNSSTERAECMSTQLSQLASDLEGTGVHMTFARYPALLMTAPTLKDSVETYPDCYPSRSMMKVHHPGLDDEDSWRGIFGNTCSHMRLVNELAAVQEHQSDYYMIMEDDVVIDRSRFCVRIAGISRL